MLGDLVRRVSSLTVENLVCEWFPMCAAADGGGGDPVQDLVEAESEYFRTDPASRSEVFDGRSHEMTRQQSVRAERPGR